jgi:hypothetical protein
MPDSGQYLSSFTGLQRNWLVISLGLLSFIDSLLVPIYDGRAHKGKPFRFTDEDFNSLESYPMYEKGIRDVDLDSIVAAGYTAGVWPASNPTNLSLNIQFLIVLT